MRKVSAIILTVCVLLTAFIIPSSAGNYPEMKVEVDAKAAVLMDAATGKVLMAKNADAKLYPASVTKIMSLLLISEAVDSGKISLTDVVTASAEACSKGGSQIWLKEGEQMTVDDLLKATAIASANDACTALGEFLAGDDASFVKMMNERAAELGMKNTNFENCTGLDDTAKNHLTTAYDIALMSRELIKHKLVLNYTTTWMDSLRAGKTELVNTNKLIKTYKGITGLKTGTTSKAGCCVSATAQRDGLSLIAVVLGSENSKQRFAAAKAMLDWGFANYACVQLNVDKSMLTNVNVISGFEKTVKPKANDGTRALVKKGEEKNIETKVNLPVDVEAPVEKGQVLGEVSFTLNGKEIGSISLYAEKEIKKMTFYEQFRRFLISACI